MNTNCGQYPYYLFEFINDINGNTLLFSAPNNSNFPCVYQEFNIIETATTYVNLTDGIVNLYPVGEWRYNVYEASAQTLFISATTGQVLDTGKVIVDGEDAGIPSLYQ